MKKTKSGRPEPGEYASYAQGDIDRVAGDDIVAAFELQIEDTAALLAPFDDSEAGVLVYAPGKWTLKQVVHHLSDDERIFAYRCLCIARNDSRPLAGFDEKQYAEAADSNSQPLNRLIDELRIVRRATVALLAGLTSDAWLARGLVNGYSATVRGLAFHIAGHEKHHALIIREKYLPLIGR
jgi:hypothetical protein